MEHLSYLWWGHLTTCTSERLHISVSEAFLHGNLCSIAMTTSTEMDHVPLHRAHKYTPAFFELPQYCLIFITLLLSATLSTSSMNTRQKNQSSHPGIPDMTPSQLASAGLSHVRNSRRTSNKKSNKKPTKDQQIAELKDQLRAAQDLISNVSHFAPHPYLITLTNCLFSRAVRMSLWPTIVHKSHWLMQAVTPTPQPTSRRPRLLW